VDQDRGEVSREVKGSLAIATFRHATSLERDPQLAAARLLPAPEADRRDLSAGAGAWSG
jgi:hypothetical protein